MISSERPSDGPAAPPAPARPGRPRYPLARAAAAPAPAPRALALAVALLLALAAVLLTAGRADAHNALQGTDPADGSTVDAPPARITLTFDQPAQALGTEIVVVGPDGSTVSTGDAELVDSTVSQALAADLPAGAYRVEWRVTSADGHPLSGSLAFTAAAGSAAGTPAPTAPEPIEPTADPTTAAEATAPSPEATASATLAPQQELAEDEDAGIAAGTLVAIAVAVLAAAAVAVVVVRERRRSAHGSDDPRGPAGTGGGDGRAEG